MKHKLITFRAKDAEQNARVIHADVAVALYDALERITIAFSTARELAIKEPIAATPLVMELQTSGGALYAAQEALRFAASNYK